MSKKFDVTMLQFYNVKMFYKCIWEKHMEEAFGRCLHGWGRGGIPKSSSIIFLTISCILEQNSFGQIFLPFHTIFKNFDLVGWFMVMVDGSGQK